MKYLHGMLLIIWVLLMFNVIDIQGQTSYEITEIEYSPDGNYIAIQGFGNVQVLYADNQDLYITLINLPDSSIVGVDWSPDSKRLVTVTLDSSFPYGQMLQVWHISGNEYAPGTLITEFDPVIEGLGVASSVNWSDDGDLIAVGTPYSGVWLWDANTFDESSTTTTYGQYHVTLGKGVSQNTVVSVAPIEEFSTISRIGEDPVNNFDLGSPTSIATSASFSPDGSSVAIHYTDGFVEILDAITYSTKQSFQTNSFYNPYGFHWHPTMDIVAGGSFAQEKIQFWDTNSGSLLGTISGTGSAFDFSPDGQEIVHRSLSGGIELTPLSEVLPQFFCDHSIVSGDVTGLISAINSANGDPDATTVCLDE